MFCSRDATERRGAALSALRELSEVAMEPPKAPRPPYPATPLHVWTPQRSSRFRSLFSKFSPFEFRGESPVGVVIGPTTPKVWPPAFFPRVTTTSCLSPPFDAQFGSTGETRTGEASTSPTVHTVDRYSVNTASDVATGGRVSQGASHVTAMCEQTATRCGSKGCCRVSTCHHFPSRDHLRLAHSRIE